MANFFDDGSPYLNHPLLTPERTATEAEQLAKVLALRPGATILDIGCGFGRHTVALAAAGYPTVGLDPSVTMVAAARRAAKEAEVSGATFTVGGGESLTEVDQYDAAICMFTSLGQVDSDGRDNRSMLTSVARAVRSGGHLVVEVPVRDRAVAALVTEETFGAGDSRTEVSRQFDPGTKQISERFAVYQNGQATEFSLGYHLFSPDDLIELLDSSGFQTVAVRPSLDALRERSSDLIELSPDDGFMLALAAVR